MSMTRDQAITYFPTKVIVDVPKPDRLKYLFLAPPKFGKTTFFSGCPNCLLLAFEEGHMFAQCHKVVINEWAPTTLKDRGPLQDDETGIVYSTALEIIEALEAYNPYRFVVIDTIDMAVKMCTDYECGKGKIQHPSDGGDYGKGYDIYQTQPIRRFYNRFVKLGVGVACTSHIKEEWRKDKYGQELYRRESTLSSSVQRFIHTQSDVIVNGYFGRKKPRKGKQIRDRIISFDGTDEIMAGTRIQRVFIPNKYISSPPTDDDASIPWKQWNSFFTDSPKAGQQAEKEYMEQIKTVDSDSAFLAAEAKSAAEENQPQTTKSKKNA
jgi:AAA domain-containing protein